MSMQMSRKCKNSLKHWAMEMNKLKSRWSNESAEGPSSSVLSDNLPDLPVLIDSSDDEENLDDVNYEEQLTKEDM